MTRIVCRQLAPRVGELGPNCELSVQAVRDAVAQGADVVVLPELVTSGYVFQSREEAASMAITHDHELFGFWADAAGGRAVVVGGFCEEGPDGLLYNSAALVDRSGVVAVYRKAHLWDREKLVFEPGGEPPPVTETAVGRIGVIICYDLEFPEMTRMLALAGAELVTVPTNWPLVDRPAGERPPEVVIAMAAARTNRMVIACCDRTGTERGQEWTAGTSVIDAAGWVRATADEQGVALADVDLAETRSKTLTELADLFGDRRPALYAAVATPGRPA
jgi:5-aminopentanamidase